MTMHNVMVLEQWMDDHGPLCLAFNPMNEAIELYYQSYAGDWYFMGDPMDAGWVYQMPVFR